MKVKIYIEGGGNEAKLKKDCRRAFTKFFERCGFGGRMPSVVSCGSRDEAFDDFETALRTCYRTDTLPLLLVDSEAPVALCDFDLPWQHLAKRDSWNKPSNATDDHAHLMVQCMETWFLADKESLSEFYGNGFAKNQLPVRVPIEDIPKDELEPSLKRAGRDTKKKGYNKGAHSFSILEEINPRLIKSACPWCKRLIDYLRGVLAPK